MGGLIGALAMGAVGGAGKGMSENAQADMKFNYEQMATQIRADMEQRIYERGRADKNADYARERTDKAADAETGLENQKGLLKFKDGLDKNDPLKALQMKKAQIELAAAEAETKLPPAVKLEYAAQQKEAESIYSEINKAKATGLYDADSATELNKRLEDINKRMSALITPYQGDKVPKPGAGVDLSAFDKKKQTKSVGSTGSWE